LYITLASERKVCWLGNIWAVLADKLWDKRKGMLVRGATPLACANSLITTGGKEMHNLAWTLALPW